MRHKPLHSVEFFAQFFVCPSLPTDAVDALLQGLHVGEEEFGFDDADVAYRVDTAFDMDDIVVFEAADDFEYGLALTDVGEKFVAEAFALAGAAYESGDVDKVDRRVDDALGVLHFGEFFDARIGYGNGRLVGLDGAEGVVGGLRVLRAREGVEKG